MNDEQIWIYWNHFLYLEELLLSSEKHVAFVSSNFKSTSVTFMHIILAACSDIECIFKDLFSLKQSCGINNIIEKLQDEHSDFFDIKIQVPALKFEQQPWRESKNKSVPLWWSSYNYIKHNGNSEPYRGASLELAILSLAGLFSVNLAYYSTKVGKDFSQNINLPKFFSYPGLAATIRVTTDSFNVKVLGFV